MKFGFSHSRQRFAITKMGLVRQIWGLALLLSASVLSGNAQAANTTDSKAPDYTASLVDKYFDPTTRTILPTGLESLLIAVGIKGTNPCIVKRAGWQRFILSPDTFAGCSPLWIPTTWGCRDYDVCSLHTYKHRQTPIPVSKRCRACMRGSWCGGGWAVPV